MDRWVSVFLFFEFLNDQKKTNQFDNILFCLFFVFIFLEFLCFVM